MTQSSVRKPVRRSPGFVARIAIAAATVAALASCTTADLGPDPGPVSGIEAPTGNALPPAKGEIIGRGPVRVALLLPLSGEPGLAAVGQSMANAARLAMDFIVATPTLGQNISLVLKDTGALPSGATAAAIQAVSEGASLILGPLRAEQVTAVGAVARPAGIPVIGFSNNSGAAAPGVYLLNILPEIEARRTLRYAREQGRQAFASIVPATDYGRVQEGAFRQAAADLGLNARAVYSFGNEAEARAVVQQVAPLIESGQIDALFLPDRSTAPSFGVLFEEAGIASGNVQIIGSADWNGDVSIASTPWLSGAVYPAVDDTGYLALKTEYEAKFGSTPHALSTIAYTATVLANASSLALGTPRYDRTQLTLPGGFNGRDGLFRFLGDGRSEYALMVKQVVVGGAKVVDGPKL